MAKCNCCKVRDVKPGYNKCERCLSAKIEKSNISVPAHDDLAQRKGEPLEKETEVGRLDLYDGSWH
jgi:hypothetical protein